MYAKGGIEILVTKCLRKVFHRPAKPSPVQTSEPQTFNHEEAATIKTVRQNFTIVIRCSGSDIELVVVFACTEIQSETRLGAC